MTKLIIPFRNFGNAPTNCIGLFVCFLYILVQCCGIVPLTSRPTTGPAFFLRITDERIQSAGTVTTGKGISKRVSETSPKATLSTRNPKIDPGSPEPIPRTMARPNQTVSHLSHHIWPSVLRQNVAIGCHTEAEYPTINDMFTLGSWQQANWPPSLPDGTWLAGISYDVTLFGVVSYKYFPSQALFFYPISFGADVWTECLGLFRIDSDDFFFVSRVSVRQGRQKNINNNNNPVKIGPTGTTSKYKDLIKRIQCVWNVNVNVNAQMIPVIVGPTGTTSEPLTQYLSNLIWKHETKELQKTAILVTAHTHTHTHCGKC